MDAPGITEGSELTRSRLRTGNGRLNTIDAQTHTASLLSSAAPTRKMPSSGGPQRSGHGGQQADQRGSHHNSRVQGRRDGDPSALWHGSHRRNTALLRPRRPLEQSGEDSGPFGPLVLLVAAPPPSATGVPAARPVLPGRRGAGNRPDQVFIGQKEQHRPRRHVPVPGTDRPCDEEQRRPHAHKHSRLAPAETAMTIPSSSSGSRSRHNDCGAIGHPMPRRPVSDCGHRHPAGPGEQPLPWPSGPRITPRPTSAAVVRPGRGVRRLPGVR